MSGGYEDDVDNSEDVVYTGQGGNDLLSTKKQIKDQKMEKGNLALKVRFSCSTYLRFPMQTFCHRNYVLSAICDLLVGEVLLGWFLSFLSTDQ